MTTPSAWITTWQTLAVAGVSTKSYPPLSLTNVRLPAVFPVNWSVNRVLSGGDDIAIGGCAADDYAVEYAVTMYLPTEAVSQSNQETNYTALGAIVDAFKASLDAVDVVAAIEYTLDVGATVEVAGSLYWGVIAEIKGRNE
ncbi:MAG: hypothetical protein M9928_21725 [Anaerolineae bacterium]|nr:hypothetical protein [Anaerolineae bacterium]MCO5195442.1 hypothetical protein [Anaerolineae bacterium]MCO5200000.1 hypothetical protein [Anaerolineae bacterium]MCO5207636.1 hypothetical protein [Anaerolineae bacterium]